MGRNCARDGHDPQLLLADDQRPRLLRQAARLILAGRHVDALHRRPQRGRNAPPLRDCGPRRSRHPHAAGATPLRRRSHRIARRLHPRNQLQLRILFAPRLRRRRDDHRRTRRAVSVSAQPGSRRRMVGRRALADHGRDLAHQRAARIRAADPGDRCVLPPARRMGRAMATSLARYFRRADALAHRAQSLVLQFLHDRRRRGRCRRVRNAIPDLVAPDGLREGPPDGFPRKRDPVLRTVRPSRPDLSLCVRNLRADGAVVDAPSRGAGRDASLAQHRRRTRARAIASRWFISGRRSYSSRSRARAAATTSCRFCLRPRCWSPGCSRCPMRSARRSAAA